MKTVPAQVVPRDRLVQMLLPCSLYNGNAEKMRTVSWHLIISYFFSWTQWSVFFWIIRLRKVKWLHGPWTLMSQLFNPTPSPVFDLYCTHWHCSNTGSQIERYPGSTVRTHDVLIWPKISPDLNQGVENGRDVLLMTSWKWRHDHPNMGCDLALGCSILPKNKITIYFFENSIFDFDLFLG